MKTASKNMPKYKSKPTSRKAWFFLLCIIVSLLWLIWETPYLLLLIPIIFVAAKVDSKKREKHFNQLKKQRTDESICTFSRYFKTKEVDTWVIRAVYEQLQDHLDTGNDSVPIRPSDNLFEDLKLDYDDLEMDIIEEIAQRTGRSLKDFKSNPYYEKINTVENLVLFFNNQPKVDNN